MQINMSKILEFLQSSTGEMSSKRLGYLSTVPASIFGTIYMCNKLIEAGNPSMAVDLWNSFLVFSAVLGGFVSVEVILPIIKAIKGTKEEVIITGQEVKNDQLNY